MGGQHVQHGFVAVVQHLWQRRLPLEESWGWGGGDYPGGQTTQGGGAGLWGLGCQGYQRGELQQREEEVRSAEPHPKLPSVHLPMVV